MYSRHSSESCLLFKGGGGGGRGEVNFKCLTKRGGGGVSEKFKNGGGSMVQGQVFLKEWGGGGGEMGERGTFLI